MAGTTISQIRLRCIVTKGADMDIAIDLGKRKSYVVMEDDGKVVKEGYTEASKYGLSAFFGDAKDPKIVVGVSRP